MFSDSLRLKGSYPTLVTSKPKCRGDRVRAISLKTETPLMLPRPEILFLLASFYRQPRTQATQCEQLCATLSLLEQQPKRIRIAVLDHADEPIEREPQPLERLYRMGIASLNLVVDLWALTHYGGCESL